MTIKNYINKLSFEKCKLYFRENKRFESCQMDVGDKSVVLEIDSENQISNSVILDDGTLNPSFKEVKTFESKEQVNEILNFELSNICPTFKLPFFDSAFIFEKENEICAVVNIDLRNRIAQTNEENILAISVGFVKSMNKILDELNLPIDQLKSPFQLRIFEYWRNFRFPFEFYYNPIFKSFESSFGSDFMQFDRWYVWSKLQIESSNKVVSKNQILRIQSLQTSRREINKFLVKNFWELYQNDKEDYELPNLDDEEQLFYFVKPSSFYVPEKKEAPIRIFFRTWDDEHGHTVLFYNEQKIEF